MPRAIIAALLVVTSIYILVAFAGLGTQDAAEFGSDEQAGLVCRSSCATCCTADLGVEHPGARCGDLDLLRSPWW